MRQSLKCMAHLLGIAEAADALGTGEYLVECLRAAQHQHAQGGLLLHGDAISLRKTMLPALRARGVLAAHHLARFKLAQCVADLAR